MRELSELTEAEREQALSRYRLIGAHLAEEELRQCVILLATELKQVYTAIAQMQELARGIPAAMADAACRRPAGRKL